LSDLPWYIGYFSGKHWLRNIDYSIEDIFKVLEAAKDLKEKFHRGEETIYLKGKTLYLIFYNKSLRTRNSFQTGIYQLGGMGIYISPDQVYAPTLPEDMIPYQTEAIRDVARVLSR